jgi:hypothetical protein
MYIGNCDFAVEFVALSGHNNLRSRNAEARPVTLSEWGHGTTQQTSTVKKKSALRTLYSFKYLSHASIQAYGPEVLPTVRPAAVTLECFGPVRVGRMRSADFYNSLMSVAATASLWADSERLRRPTQNQREVFNTRPSRQARSSSLDGRKLLVTHSNSFFVCLSTKTFKR